MRAPFNKLPRWTLTLGLATALATPSLALANGNGGEESPTALAMTGDLLIARPMLLVGTLISSAVYVVSLPFSLAGGNEPEARENLVVGPAKATFVRCLGCTKTGRKQALSGG